MEFLLAHSNLLHFELSKPFVSNVYAELISICYVCRKTGQKRKV